MNNIKNKSISYIYIYIMMYLQGKKGREWCSYEQSYPFLVQGLPNLPKSFGGMKMIEKGLEFLFREVFPREKERETKAREKRKRERKEHFWNFCACNC